MKDFHKLNEMLAREIQENSTMRARGFLATTIVYNQGKIKGVCAGAGHRVMGRVK